MRPHEGLLEDKSWSANTVRPKVDQRRWHFPLVSHVRGMMSHMLAIRFLLWSVRRGIAALVILWSTYIVLHTAAATVAAALVPAPAGVNPDYLPGTHLKEGLANLADTVGHIAAFGTTPTPMTAGIFLASVAVLGVGRRAAGKLLEKSRPKELDTVDIDDFSGLPAPDPPPVVTAIPHELGFAVLDQASRLTVSPALEDVIAREELYARRLIQDHLYATRYPDLVEDEALMATGPVQAILLDPLLTSFTGDLRTARVQQILAETKPAPFLVEVAPVLLPLVGICGLGGLLTAGHVPMLLALPASIVLFVSMLIPRRRHAYLRGPNRVVVPARYPKITLDDALQLAALAPKLRHTAPSRTSSPTPGTLNHRPEHAHGRITQLFADVAADRASAERLPSRVNGGSSTTVADQADRRRRIAEVHAAVAELDAEWLDYQLDLHAWFLAKPQLRNLNDPVTKAYRQAEADLRDRADDLTDNSTDQQITDAQEAARLALKAWDTANRHAMKIGVSTLSPTEEAALHRLHGLVGQLNDRATPKAMWPQLINAITRTMDKLTTVPCTLADIAKLPVIESESRLRAIEQHTPIEGR